MGRPRKGIYVPFEIWRAKDLSWEEKALLIEIDSLTSRGMECYFSNSFIAEMMGIQERSASGLIASLIKKGYVRQLRFDGRLRYVESCMDSRDCIAEICEADSQVDLQEIAMQDSKNLQEKITNEDKKKLRKEIYKEKKKQFSPPTHQMITDYSRQRGFADPEGFAEHFFSYYSEGIHPWHLSNGKPMKDWKRAVITWERDSKGRMFSKPEQPKQATYDAFQKFMQ